ncbi:MAG: hypothetical protein LUE61_09240 [Clostridiales bacterium]|nr:hypothetical protein [Clostridiales bacterium]
MMMKELSKYQDTMRQVERDRGILENLRSRASPASPALTGMPHGNDVSDKTAALGVECAAMEERIKQLREQAEQEHKALEQFIATISDERVAVAVSLRFVHGMSWKEAGELLNFWDASGCRKMVSRYLAHGN